MLILERKPINFCKNCGVKNEPTPIDFAESLVKSSHELWNSIKLSGDNVKKYVSILRRIVIEFKMFGSITRQLSLIEKMKLAPILVAVRKMDNINNNINNNECKF